MIQHLSIATLESFLWGMQPFCLIHHIKAHISWSGIDFLDDHYVGAYFSQLMMDFESWPSPREDYTSFFTLEHETWLVYFISCTLDKGITLSIDDGFWGIVVPWRWLDSFHIGVRDMTEWFLWCDYRSIAFSSLLTNFWDDWIRTQTLVRACSGV